jgi:peptidyl-prolyl cis-trans isomerase D
VDKKPATTRPLEEVRAQIADQLAYERAQAQAAEVAESLRTEIDDPSDLDRVAKARGLTVQESGFFEREEPIAGLGPAPEVAEQAFALEDGQVAGPIRVARGQVFLATIGRQEARLPSLDEVKERVTTDGIAEKAREASRQRAAALAPELKSNFAAAAKRAGLTVRSTELVPRGSALPDVGVTPAIDTAVFALPVGGVTDPIVTDAGTVVAKVVERQEVSPGELQAARDGLRTELLNEQRSRFFSAYMAKARERMRTTINEESVRRVLG